MSWDELQAMAFAYLLRSQLEKFLLQEVFVVQETLLSPVGPRDFETKKLKNIYFKFKTPLKVKPLLEKFAERSADMDADTDITKFWIADTDIKKFIASRVSMLCGQFYDANDSGRTKSWTVNRE